MTPQAPPSPLAPMPHPPILLLDPSLFTLPFDIHFARGLAAEGAEVHLAGRPLRPYERLAGEPLIFHPLFYRLGERGAVGWHPSQARRALKGLEHLFGYLRLARLIAGTGIGVLHVQWLLLPLLDRPLLSRLRSRVRLFLTVHNADLLAHSVEVVAGRFVRLLQAVGRRELLALFDGFIAHTEKTTDHLSRLGIERRRILLLPHPPLALAPGLLAATGKADGPPHILFFGAIKPYKGVDVLVEAALRLVARGRLFTLTLAGRPYFDLAPLLARVQAAGARDRFRFELDYVPDERLDGLLRQADLVVFPYREIDGSGALALAASYGKAIVASRIGVFAEPPVADRVALVEPEDVDGLAAVLDRLLADPAARAALARRAAGLAAELGDWRAYARACLAFYAATSSR
ncbi:GDP-mannose:glycolipid 4-beta-D-mannosyltransferase [bacterium HR40]|nr:GDP-mannose:glycolipid 4-beta-D-mannosyltransferase [bacterium HR40]